MSNVATILDFSSLILEFTGTLVIYYNVPKPEPEGYVPSDYDSEKEDKKREITARKSKCGLLLLALGFAMQFISLLIKSH